jgi:hypothetical protein
VAIHHQTQALAACGAVAAAASAAFAPPPPATQRPPSSKDDVIAALDAEAHGSSTAKYWGLDGKEQRKGGDA